MRGILLAALLALGPGCIDLRDGDGSADGGWPGTEGVQGIAGREAAFLGGRSVSTPGPASSWDFDVHVPAGGATQVAWTLDITGASGLSSIEGPGCSDYHGIQVGVASDRVTGTCEDLPEGPHQFRIVVEGAAVELRGEVRGFVVA